MAYLGRGLDRGNYIKLDDISSQFNGSAKSFNLRVAGKAFYPGSAFSILVSVGGTIQEPANSYTIDRDVIIFTTAPNAATPFFCVALGQSLNINVPGDGTVSGEKLSQPFSYDNGLLYLDHINNRVGINTVAPTSSLDVNNEVTISRVYKINAGIVTSSTLSTFTVDSFDISSYRSCKYNVQVKTPNQLATGDDSSLSIKDRRYGNDYIPGTYTNLDILTLSGAGSSAKATVSISTEFTLPVIESFEGIFRTSSSITGIATGKTVILNNFVPPSDYEQSKISSIRITDVGYGYTSVPVISFSAPLVGGNPVAGVGIGSTAVVTSVTLGVSTVAINTSVVVSSGLPTVSFPTPTGGTAATGIVGFGISSVSITANGSGYNPLPVILFDKDITVGTGLSLVSAGSSLGNEGQALVAISSVFLSNLVITNPGFGYSPYNLPVNINITAPTVTSFGSSLAGYGRTATATHSSFSIADDFVISNRGSGYTAPPTLTVGAPNIGINTARVRATLGIVTFTIANRGRGYSSAPRISVSPTITGFIASVGMGITTDGVGITSGSGYNVGVTTFVISPVGGIGTGAQMSVASYTGTGGIAALNITNIGTGYTTPPTVTIQNSSGGTGGAVRLTQLILSNVDIVNPGYGLTIVPTIQLSPRPSAGCTEASLTPVLGIGSIIPVGFGSGYTTSIPGIAVTAADGVTGGGGIVTCRSLGISTDCLIFTNPGAGYTISDPLRQAFPILYIDAPSKAIGGNIGINTTLITGIDTSFVKIGQPVFANSLYPVLPASTTVVSIGIGTVGIGTTTTNITAQNAVLFNFGTVGAAATGYIGVGISALSVVGTGFGYTSRHLSIITPGAGSGFAATVTNVFVTNVQLTNPGAGYSAANLPVTPTFSTAGVGATVYYQISGISYSTGLGYTGTPTVTVGLSTVRTPVGVRTAAVTATIGYGATYYLQNGPGYGGTTVYYFQPECTVFNTFSLHRNRQRTDRINLGFSTSVALNACIGGTVSSLVITNPGYEYQVGAALSVYDTGMNANQTNVGTGVSFVVNAVVSNYQVSDVMVLHSAGTASTDAKAIEYGGLSNEHNLGTYSADISGNQVRLRFTPIYRTNEIKFNRSSLTD